MRLSIILIVKIYFYENSIMDVFPGDKIASTVNNK